MHTDIIVAFGTAGSAIIAFAAFIIAIIVSKQAKRSVNANIISSFFEQYNGREMHLALEKIGALESDIVELDFLRELSCLRGEKQDIQKLDNRAVEISKKYISLADPNKGGDDRDIFRHRISGYYNQVWTLHFNGLIDEKIYHIIAKSGGVGLTVRTVWSMSAAKFLIENMGGDLDKFKDRYENRFGWYRRLIEIVDEDDREYQID